MTAVAVRDVQRHLLMVAMMGTAKHLIEGHKLDPDKVDPEDVEGLHHDHIYLHGGRLHENGTVTWVNPNLNHP